MNFAARGTYITYSFGTMAGWSHSHQGEVAARSSRTAGGTLQKTGQCFVTSLPEIESTFQSDPHWFNQSITGLRQAGDNSEFFRNRH